MLHDPRKDIGSKAHIIAWLERKPADETFQYCHVEKCACGQYSAEFFGDGSKWVRTEFDNIHAMNRIAGDIKLTKPLGRLGRPEVTFGILLAVIKKAWA